VEVVQYHEEGRSRGCTREEAAQGLEEAEAFSLGIAERRGLRDVAELGAEIGGDPGEHARLLAQIRPELRPNFSIF
jgi:hypothetical protein